MLAQKQTLPVAQTQLAVHDGHRDGRTHDGRLDVPWHVVRSLVRVNEELVVPRFRHRLVERALQPIARPGDGRIAHRERRAGVLHEDVEPPRAHLGSDADGFRGGGDLGGDVAASPAGSGERHRRLPRGVGDARAVHEGGRHLPRVSDTHPADVSVLAQVDALPRSRLHPPRRVRRHRQRAPEEGGLDVSRHVVRALLDVFEQDAMPLLRHDSVQRRLQIPPHRRIRVFVHRQRRRRVPDEEVGESGFADASRSLAGGSESIPRGFERVVHLVLDQVASAPRGFDGDVAGDANVG
mmetsp:Transcript_4836/g.18109  ORF Transcript_4836/g.18109 Transcript_4836/m.18109 type:complete len:295 (+) Transcript_4836:188-1072(+)